MSDKINKGIIIPNHDLLNPDLNKKEAVLYILEKEEVHVMFIGREAELRFLQEKYEEDKGQLLVLYGRKN